MGNSSIPEAQGQNAMKILQPILDVREIPPACAKLRQRLPSLQDYIGSTPHPHEKAVLEYLGQGVPCGVYNDRGLLFDVLQPLRHLEISCVDAPVLKGRRIQPNLILTDGVWFWPGVLLYYLQEYHLRLPEAFLEHAERQHWRIEPGAVSVVELNWDAFDAVPVADEGPVQAPRLK